MSAEILASMKVLESDASFVDVSHYPRVRLDLRYASTNNFTGRDLYGPLKRCYLHKVAAEKFKLATDIIAQVAPGYKFILFDGLRPRSVQRVLWAEVVGTEQEKYVANPDEGSIHNYGFALDLGLVDERGREVDMGTDYDHFSVLAEPQFEPEFLKTGELSEKQIGNRLLLRRVMTEAGFTQLEYEWWHYDALPREEIESNFRIIE